MSVIPDVYLDGWNDAKQGTRQNKPAGGESLELYLEGYRDYMIECDDDPLDAEEYEIMFPSDSDLED